MERSTKAWHHILSLIGLMQSKRIAWREVQCSPQTLDPTNSLGVD